MNDYAKRLVANRSYGRYPDDYRRYNHYEGDDYATRGNYEVKGDFERYDGRRGVKGTGRYGIGGSRYYPRRDRSMRGYDDYDEDYGYRDDMPYDDGRYRDMPRMDYGEMKLSKRDMQEWKRGLDNADGTVGEHFKDMQQILNVAQQQGVQYKHYDEKDLCLTVNMLYSDYCEALRSFIPPDRELPAYVRMAKAFLEDEDAPKGKEKLYLYYKCIVEDDE